MLVGGGNALDAPDVKPRLACKLGQIPAYTVSPEATTAGLQVTPATAPPPRSTPSARCKLLAVAYPESQQGLGIAGSKPVLACAAGLAGRRRPGGSSATRSARFSHARHWWTTTDHGWSRSSWPAPRRTTRSLPRTRHRFSPRSGHRLEAGVRAIRAAHSTVSPPCRQPAVFEALPASRSRNCDSITWERSGQFPVVAQAKSIMMAAVAKPNFDAFTAYALNTWMLWAQSATACGSKPDPGLRAAQCRVSFGVDRGRTSSHPSTRSPNCMTTRHACCHEADDLGMGL